MAIKISDMTSNPAPALTDQLEVNAGGVTYRDTIAQIVALANLVAAGTYGSANSVASIVINANKQITDIVNTPILISTQQVSNLYGGGVQSIPTGNATSHLLTYPLAQTYKWTPDAGVTLSVTLPEYDSAQCQLGQPLNFINAGGTNSAVQLFDKDGVFITNTSIGDGQFFTSWLGENTVTSKRFGTIASLNQEDLDVKLDKDAGGTMVGNLILNGDATLPLQAVPLQQLQTTPINSSQITSTPRSVNTDTAFTLADANNTIIFTNTTGNKTCTLSNNGTAAIPVNGFVDVILLGNGATVGTVSFSPDSGVTNFPLVAVVMNYLGQRVRWQKTATNTWVCVHTSNYINATNGSLSGVTITSSYGTFLTLNLRNVANTFTNSFSAVTTADRQYDWPDASGMVQVLNPITEGSSTTARTLALTDANGEIRTTNTTADTVYTIPANATAALPISGKIRFVNGSGAGNNRLLSVIPAGGVTLTPFNPVVGDSGVIEIEKINTNEWKVVKCYESGTLTCSWSGVWASSQSGNLKFERDMAKVKIQFPTVVSTQNGAGTIVSTAGVIPSRLRPLTAAFGTTWIYSNGLDTLGGFQVGTGGTITFYYYDPTTKNLAASFPNSAGQTGFNGSAFPDYLII